MAREIPKQLQKPEFRFVRVATKDKIPLDLKWEKDGNYKFDDPVLLKHIQEGGNVGLVAGFGNVGILDIDTKEAIEKLKDVLITPTLTTLSGGKRLPHFIYQFDKKPEPFTINMENEKYYLNLNSKTSIRVLDFKGVGGQCLIPPSKTTNDYEVLFMNEIATIKYDDLVLKIKKVFSVVEKTILTSYQSKSIIDMAIKFGVEVLERGKVFQSICPFHKDTDPSLTFYPETNTFHCFGCEAHGDILAFEKRLDYIRDYQEFQSSILSGRSLLKKSFPERRWFVDRIIPEGAIVNHSGKASTLKTMTALNFLLSIATDKRALNVFKTIKCNILFLDTENGWRELQKRIRYLCNGMGIKDDEIENNIFFLSEKYVRLDDDSGIRRLTDYIKENNIKIICIDGLKRFTGFDENNASEVNDFFNVYIRPLIIETGITFYYIMHLRKSVGNGQSSDDPLDEARGSGELVNIPDVVIYNKQSRGNTNNFTLKVLKNRLDTILPPQSIEYGWNEDKLVMTCMGEAQELINADVQCSKEILEYLSVNTITLFSPKTIKDIKDIRHSIPTKNRAIKVLLENKSIVKIGRGSYSVVGKISHFGGSNT